MIRKQSSSNDEVQIKRAIHLDHSYYKTNDELAYKCNLSGTKSVTVFKNTNGDYQVQLIRTFFKKQQQFSEILITLDVNQLLELKERFDELQIALTEVKRGKSNIALNIKIGKLVFVTVKSGFQYIDIRRYFVPWQTGVLKPTQKGISLTHEESIVLKEFILKILSIIQP